jgi:N-acetylglucosaminyl-diphospho-decaprenol L-rhamnosyltransferase
MSDDVEILIPHHTGREALRRALEALRRQTVPAEVCVVDNGSADGSREMLAAEYPEVRVLSLGVNRGFGAAVNAGARSSDARTVCFLNNDAEADEGFVEQVLATAAASGAEAVAGVLRLPDGTIDTAGVQADRSLVAYDHLHGAGYPPPADVAPPLGPCGGAAAFDRSALLRLGGFDEGFFAYLEDVDLAIRLRVAGMRCAIATRAFAWHRHAGTLGAGSAAKNRLLGRGRGRLLWKYGAVLSPGARARGTLVDGVTYLGQLALDRNAAAIHGRLEERRAHRHRPRPAAPDLDGVPLLERGAIDSLRRRWSRGRRYRKAS